MTNNKKNQKKKLANNQQKEQIKEEIVWKQIKGFSSRYFINNLGDVKCVFEPSVFGNQQCTLPPKILKKTLFYGYDRVALRDSKRNYSHKSYYIHELMMEYFFMNDDNYDIITHINGDLLNNNINNLKWTKKPIEPHKIGYVEKWKDIKGYEERYRVSNLGEVYSKLTNIIIALDIKNGYAHVKLNHAGKKSKSFRLNILVAKHFIPNPENKPVVDHIDNNRLNNKFDNLRWATHPENAQSYIDNFKKKRAILQFYTDDNDNDSDEDNFIKEWIDANEIIASKKNYMKGTITNACRKKCSAYGYLWIYKEEKEKIIIELKEGETFKKIGKFDDADFSNYKVSTHGKVMNIATDKFIKPRLSESGYLRIGLISKKDSSPKILRVNRLVAFVYVEGRTEEKNVSHHKDENKLNNHYKNLEWTTDQGNTTYSLGIKVNQIDMKTNKIIKTFASIKEAGRIFSKNAYSAIGKCCKGTRKSTQGFKWAYAKVDADNEVDNTDEED